MVEMKVFLVFVCKKDVISIRSPPGFKLLQNLDWLDHKWLQKYTFYPYTISATQFLKVWLSYNISNMWIYDENSQKRN